MKRGWIGLGLLVVLMVTGSLSAWRIRTWQEPMGQALDRAGQWALAGDWERAAELSRQAEDAWKEKWHRTAAFVDHGPMESADGLFAQLAVYRKLEDRAAYAAVCAELARQLEAIGEGQVPSWWNLL